jgi:diphthamide biosynthesis methyltransferase
MFRASKIDFEIDFEGEIILSKILLEVSETQYASYLKERTLVTISANIKNEKQVLSESRIESKHKMGFNEINSAFVLSIPCEDCEKKLLRKLFFTIDSNLLSHTLMSAAFLVKN